MILAWASPFNYATYILGLIYFIKSTGKWHLSITRDLDLMHIW